MHIVLLSIYSIHSSSHHRHSGQAVVERRQADFACRAVDSSHPVVVEEVCCSNLDSSLMFVGRINSLVAPRRKNHIVSYRCLINLQFFFTSSGECKHTLTDCLVQ